MADSLLWGSWKGLKKWEFNRMYMKLTDRPSHNPITRFDNRVIDKSILSLQEEYVSLTAAFL